MVRLAVALFLGLAGTTSAQEADLPPRVASDPPLLALPDTGDAASAGVAFPSETAPPPPLDAASDSAPAMPPAVETDLLSLVEKAHPVVQAVMALLVLNVFTVLTVFLFKAVEFTVAFARLRREALDLGGMDKLGPTFGSGPLARSVQAAHDELQALPTRLTPDLRISARERLDLTLARIEAGAVRQLRSGTGLLASIGAVAPFVGLFGTVFGIMNSFLAIAATQTTNLSVVAPGIAEALLATGIGLAAAIPAVMLYNRSMRRIGEFRHRLADGTADILRRFSREMDARMANGR